MNDNILTIQELTNLIIPFMALYDEELIASILQKNDIKTITPDYYPAYIPLNISAIIEEYMLENSKNALNVRHIIDVKTYYNDPINWKNEFRKSLDRSITNSYKEIKPFYEGECLRLTCSKEELKKIKENPIDIYNEIYTLVAWISKAKNNEFRHQHFDFYYKEGHIKAQKLLEEYLELEKTNQDTYTRTKSIR